MNRKIATAVFVALMSVAAFAQAGGAAAPAANAPAAAGPTKVGIINITEAIFASNEGQRDFAALQKKFEPKQSEIQKSNSEIEELKKQLSTQGDKLNDDARASLAKNIESKQKVLQRSYEDAQGDFEQERNQILQRIGTKLMNVLESYAQNNGYTVVLDVSQGNSPVLWASAATNITRPVVEAYNAQAGVPAQPRPAATQGGAAANKPAATTPAKPAPAPAKKP